MKRLALLLISIGLISACNDAPEIDPNTRLHVSNNSSSLSTRVRMVNQDLGFIQNNQGGTRGEAASNSVDFLAPEFELVAEIKSPNINGEVLSATHVAIEGNYAYVSYHLADDPFGGGFDVIDLSNQNNIRISSQALYTDTDFNALTVDNEETLSEGVQRVYLAGSNSQSALVERIDIENGIILENNDSLPLEGNNANGIVRTKHMLYVTVGGRDNKGGLRAIDMRSGPKFFTVNEKQTFSDAKDVAVSGPDINDDMLVLRGGSSASIYTYEEDANGIDVKRSYNIDPISILDGKNTIRMDDNYIYTALSEQGVKVYDLGNIGNGPIHHITSEEMGGGLSNAVAVDDNHVYVANGLSGLYIGDKPSRNNFEMSGALNVSGSANFIAAKNDYIIIANGISGTQILKRKASETSIDLEDRDIIYESFQPKGGEYRGGNYGEKDADDLEDLSHRKKNPIQIPISDLESLTEVSFEYESDQDYIFKVYLGYDEGQYDEQIFEVESKKNKGWKEANLELDESGYKYLILSAIPTNKKKGRANFRNIEIKGIK